MTALTRAALGSVAAAPPVGIVHLGLGNFHRAHQAVYTAAALAAEPGDWGVLGVASRSHAVVDALRAQDHLYAVLEVSPAGDVASVPGVHAGSLVAADDPEAVVAAIADRDVRVITLTVTENGYRMSPVSGGLALDADDVAHDLRGGAPATTVGLVARALERRCRTHGTPLTVLSCDNMHANGATTRSLVLEFLQAAGAADEVLAWVGDAVRFPDSMVDRIVPATAPGHVAAVRRLIGLDDRVPVPAEPFSMWVMADDFARGRPAWERAGAVFSDEVAAYETVKLRLLNGTHSLIAYLGALDGRATIPDSCAQEFVEGAARAVIAEDYLPSTALPRELDADAYVADLFRRWTNTSLGHRTSQVGSDGSLKLRQRVPVPALAALARGRLPQHLALTVAAWLCCVAPLDGFDPGPHARAMVDPARGRLAELSRATGDPGALATAALVGERMLGAELAEQPAFVARVAELTTVIRDHGPRTAAREALGGEAADGSPPGT